MEAFVVITTSYSDLEEPPSATCTSAWPSTDDMNATRRVRVGELAKKEVCFGEKLSRVTPSVSAVAVTPTETSTDGGWDRAISTAGELEISTIPCACRIDTVAYLQQSVVAVVARDNTSA
jgi:hypothetical protein